MENCGLQPMNLMKFSESTLNKFNTRTIFLVAFLLCLAACLNKKKGAKTKKTVQTPSLFKIPTSEIDSTEIVPIAQLYVRSCGSCHQAYEKDAYNAETWRIMLDSMQHRAHISDMDKAKLYVFLTGDTAYRFPVKHKH